LTCIFFNFILPCIFVGGYKFLFFWFIYSVLNNLAVYLSVILKFVFPTSKLVDFFTKEILFPFATYVSHSSRYLSFYDIFFNFIYNRTAIEKFNKTSVMSRAHDSSVRGYMLDARRAGKELLDGQRFFRPKYLRTNVDYFVKDESRLLNRFVRLFSSRLTILRYITQDYLNRYEFRPFQTSFYARSVFYALGSVWNHGLNSSLSYGDIFVRSSIVRPVFKFLFGNFYYKLNFSFSSQRMMYMLRKGIIPASDYVGATLAYLNV